MPINIKFPSGNTGLDTSDATAAADKILEDYTAYVNGVKVTGTIQSKPAAQYIPTTTDQVISGSQYLSGPQTIAGDANLVANNIADGVTIFGVEGTAEVDSLDWTQVTLTADTMLSGIKGYNSSKEIVTGTIPNVSVLQYMPSTSDITIESGQYINSDLTISGDADLIPENIKVGTTIFDVVGSYEGVDTSDATAIAGEILDGKTAYVNGVKLTGTIPFKTSETYTPTTIDQIIASGQYLSGNQTISGDVDLVAGNIKSGISIFGVTGSYAGLDTSDATASADEILEDKTAYVNGEKITGTYPKITNSGFTPAATDVALPHGYYDYSNCIVGDPDLLAENIKSGVNIFNVAGSYTGLDTSDATATAAQILSGATAYVDGVKITGTISNLPAEYQVILPTTDPIVIYDGYYIDQGMVIVGEPNLLSSNIKSGISIFGVAGDTNVIDTTEATNSASNANLLTGHVAFVNGQKITGSLPSLQPTTYTPTTSNQTIAGQQFLAGDQTILGDTDLVANNIRSGIEIFGVEGTFSGGSLSQNWCFKADENAVVNYGSLVYFETVGTSGGPTFSTPISLTDIVASYSGICDASTEYCLKIGPAPFGWSSTVKLVFLTPVAVTGDTILLDTIATGDPATPVTRLVQATGSGAELAANIFANSQIAGSYVNISGFQPGTNGNFITTAMYNTEGIPTGTYYIYTQLEANNFSPRFKELFQYVSA